MSRVPMWVVTRRIRHGLWKFLTLSAKRVNWTGVTSALAIVIAGVSAYYSHFYVKRDLRITLTWMDLSYPVGNRITFSFVAVNPGNRHVVLTRANTFNYHAAPCRNWRAMGTGIRDVFKPIVIKPNEVVLFDVAAPVDMDWVYALAVRGKTPSYGRLPGYIENDLRRVFWAVSLWGLDDTGRELITWRVMGGTDVSPTPKGSLGPSSQSTFYRTFSLFDVPTDPRQQNAEGDEDFLFKHVGAPYLGYIPPPPPGMAYVPPQGTPVLERHCDAIRNRRQVSIPRSNQ